MNPPIHFLAALLTITLILPAPAFADVVAGHAGPDFYRLADQTEFPDLNCDDAASPVEEALCANDLAGLNRDLQTLSADLTRILTETQATDDATPALPVFAEEEKSWKAYRNSACDREAQPHGDSVPVFVACIARFNRDRVEHLKSAIETWKQ